MSFFQTLYVYIDAFLVFFYRIPENPVLGYFVGTSVLCVLCVLFGEFTISLAFRCNKKHIDRDNSKMVRMQDLSVRALMAKDKKSFKACNKEANEAFGKVFFSQIALAASSLWPVPFAMGWMQTRFLEVEFLLPFSIPGVGSSVGYAFTFLPMYILARIFFGKIRRKLPYFTKMENVLDSYKTDPKKKKMLSYTDLMAPEIKNKSG